MQFRDANGMQCCATNSAAPKPFSSCTMTTPGPLSIHSCGSFPMPSGSLWPPVFCKFTILDIPYKWNPARCIHLCLTSLLCSMSSRFIPVSKFLTCLWPKINHCTGEAYCAVVKTPNIPFWSVWFGPWLPSSWSNFLPMHLMGGSRQCSWTWSSWPTKETWMELLDSSFCPSLAPASADVWGANQRL